MYNIVYYTWTIDIWYIYNIRDMVCRPDTEDA